MAQLRRDHEEFVTRDAEIVAIGPEDRETFAKWWREHEMPFIGLPDPEHAVADLYGQQVKLLKLGRLPAQVVVDKNGSVRYVHYGNSMSDIVENGEVLAKLDELNREGTQAP